MNLTNEYKNGNGFPTKALLEELEKRQGKLLNVSCYEANIEGIEKLEAKKQKYEKELDEYIYIDDDSLSKELKK